jgi:hypothetical protein
VKAILSGVKAILSGVKARPLGREGHRNEPAPGASAS